MEDCELIPWGSNYTFRVTLRLTDCAGLGVYKPQRGERPLWDFPSGTLYLRERAAYVLSELLGWHFVPLTIVRDGLHGVGSLQAYVEGAPLGSLRELNECPDLDLARIAAFDIISNNADRKGGHVLQDAAGKLWGIDHGLCFNTDPKVRTVLQRFCGEPLPSVVAAELGGFFQDSNQVQLMREALNPLLAQAEIDAVEARIGSVLAAGCYPRLDHYRSVPWPPF
jgi:hypothetical protein